jgi:hypothetical protein
MDAQFIAMLGAGCGTTGSTNTIGANSPVFGKPLEL